MRVLGIDAGGTKTVGYLADETGQILAEARAGAANLHASGEREVERVLREVVDQVMPDRDPPLAAVCVGMAGAERDADRQAVRAILKRIGIEAPALVAH